MLSAAKRHTLERGAGQSAVSEQRYVTRVDKRAIESMIKFAASPAAVRYLSGRSGFVAKRTTHVGNISQLYKKWCKGHGKRYVKRTFWYENAFDGTVTQGSGAPWAQSLFVQAARRNSRACWRGCTAQS